MPRLLALDWDRIEARIVVARTQGDGGIAVDKAVTVPLQFDGQDNEGLEEQLSKALSTLNVGKSQALTAIGRSLLELRTMNLPPAPDEDLPDMVRFQAMREFSSLQEESPLDFVPLRDAGQEPGEVLAAAIPLELSQQVQAALVGKGHEPTRTAMRPASAASLAIRRQPSAATGHTLVIAQQADSAELAVATNGAVVFTRSFRLPPGWHPGETGEPLLGEVRRTIAAAQNQLGGAKIDRIVMFGTEPEHTSLRERIADRTNLEVTVLDPFEGISVSGASPEQPERFAALVGMLRDEASGTPPVLDFQNPRKRPIPESNRRQHVLAVAAVATVVLGLMFLVWWKHNDLNTAIAQRKSAINKLSRENRAMGGTVALAKKLREWKQGDKNWLDELVHLSSSEELAAEDFRLESLTARTQRDFLGAITIRGRSKDIEARQKLQNELTDDHHKVVPGLVSNDAREDARYPFLFTTTMQTDRAIPINPPPPAKPVADSIPTAVIPADAAAETAAPETQSNEEQE